MSEYKMTDYDADELLTDIADLKSEKKRYEDIAIEKIENIQFTVSLKTQKIDDEIQFKKDQLAAFFLTVNKKDSKTQQSYSLLSGKLVMKKATTKLVHDDKKLIEYCKTNASEYIKQIVTDTLDWKGFKSNIEILNDQIFSSSTGEVLEGLSEIGLSIEEVAPKFDIK